VDKLIIVVEPGRASLETAFRVRELAADIGLTNLAVVANKIHDQEEEKAISARLEDFEILGFVPYDQALVEADINNQPVLDASQPISNAVDKIFHRLTAAGMKS
jgi:CO dehydrogenase maturation factor